MPKSLSIQKGTLFQHFIPICLQAALNMITKSLSVDLRKDEIIATVLHPGWVQTRMGGPDAPVPLSECIEGLISVMGQINESHSGVFLDYTGHEIPW